MRLDAMVEWLNTDDNYTKKEESCLEIDSSIKYRYMRIYVLPQYLVW